MQALKTVAYSYTAAWIAGLGHIVHWVGMAILLLGSVTVTGSAPDIGILKNAARGIDLEGLAALKDEGVQ
jgi:ABC-type tungstate transport system substrate-binding protein